MGRKTELVNWMEGFLAGRGFPLRMKVARQVVVNGVSGDALQGRIPETSELVLNMPLPERGHLDETMWRWRVGCNAADFALTMIVPIRPAPFPPILTEMMGKTLGALAQEMARVDEAGDSTTRPEVANTLFQALTAIGGLAIHLTSPGQPVLLGNSPEPMKSVQEWFGRVVSGDVDGDAMESGFLEALNAGVSKMQAFTAHKEAQESQQEREAALAESLSKGHDLPTAAGFARFDDSHRSDITASPGRGLSLVTEQEQ